MLGGIFTPNGKKRIEEKYCSDYTKIVVHYEFNRVYMQFPYFGKSLVLQCLHHMRTYIIIQSYTYTNMGSPHHNLCPYILSLEDAIPS